MEIIKSFEEFQLNESKSSEYNNITVDFKIYLKSLENELIVDGVYECHSWVTAIESYLGKYGRCLVYLADDNMDSHYYEVGNTLNSQLNPIMGKYGENNFLEYISGHSFVQVNGIFIDLTLDSMGLSFKDVQKVDKILANSKLKYTKIKI